MLIIFEFQQVSGRFVFQIDIQEENKLIPLIYKILGPEVKLSHTN